jgi:beta-galactosidase
MNNISYRIIIISILLTCNIATLYAQESSARQKLLMDFEWKFHKGDLSVNYFGKLTKSGNWGNDPGIGLKYNDSLWRSVDLPHDFAVEGVFSRDHNSGHGYLPMETEWYRRVYLDWIRLQR